MAFCCFRKRIKLASIVVKVSAKFVNENCGILFLPLILFVIMVIFLVLWILEALGYYSLGTPVHEKEQLPFQHFETSGAIKALGLAHVFQLLWVLFFLVETGDFIVAGAACSWYFQRESPYSESSDRYRKFHIGSVALGSFFLALLGFLKFLYELLTVNISIFSLKKQKKKDVCLLGKNSVGAAASYVLITCLIALILEPIQ